MTAQIFFNKNVKLKFFFILPAMVYAVISCTHVIASAETQSEQRAGKAAKGEGDVVIAVVDTSADRSLFLEGVNLAIEEINQEGGLLGRKIKALFYDDRRNLSAAQKVADKIAGNDDIVAVVGHRDSGIAIPISITYEKEGILFISPGATDPSFTAYGGAYTFRNMPSDQITGDYAAKLAVRRGFKKMAIFYQRESSGERLAEIFHEKATDLKISIVAARSYFGWQTDFRVMLSELTKTCQFDAILIIGLLPGAAELIKQARALGIKVPIMGGYALDSQELFSVAGQAADGVIVPAVFNPKLPIKEIRDFVRRFQTKFGVVPDSWAAQGYDAVQLLGYAVRESGSSVPIIMSSTLRILENWQGVTGTCSFTFDGDVTGKKIFFKEFGNGRFEYLKDESDKEEKISPFYAVEDITLRLPVEGIIPTIDPGHTEEAISIEVTEQLFLGLTDLDPKTYEAVPELAQSWTVSPDGKTYIFRLRQDAVWTDGSPVTAHDVVWAVRRNIRPETKCFYVSMLFTLKNAEAVNRGEIKDVSQIGVRATDDFTVEFTLEHPAAYFPTMAGLWPYRPLPAKAVETYGEQWTEPQNIQSNGSYKVAAWEKDIVMVLRKNPSYYDAGKISIPEVRYYIIPESSVGLAMYENNELDIMGSSYLRLPFTELARIKDDPVLNRQYSSVPHFCTYAYAFNTRRPPVNNPLVRKAISAAIDRQLLIDLITEGNEIPASTFTRPPTFGSVDPKEGIGIRFNPNQAKRWLAEAGYPDGKGFPAIKLMYNASETHAKIAEAVQTCLKFYLNIDVRPEGKEWDDFISSIEQPRTPDMIRYGWCGDYPDANGWLNDLFHPFRSSNHIGWENREFAELMDKARENSDPEARKQYYRRAEQILTEEEAVVVPLYFEIAHCLIKPRVKGWYHMAMGGQHIRDWYFEE